MQVNTLGASLVFPQVANEHIKCMCYYYNCYVSYVTGEQLIIPMKAQLCVARATSLPSSIVD